MSFLLAVDDDQIGPDATIGGLNHRAVAQPFGGLNSFCEVDFFGLRVGHG